MQVVPEYGAASCTFKPDGHAEALANAKSDAEAVTLRG